MGCDIHCFGEKKVNGKWEQDSHWENQWYEPEGKFDWNKKEFDSSPINCRNYRTFAIMANIRNGFGFYEGSASLVAEPISLPKGLPEDVCDEIKYESDEWGDDGHSHSWLTAEEILKFKHKVKKRHDYYTNIEGESSIIDDSKWLFETVLRQMMEKSSTGKGDDVRLVFWFDN